MNIILVGGKSGSGKDVFSDYLVKNFGYTKMHFSGCLKDFVAKKYSINRSVLDTQIGKKNLYDINGFKKSGRYLLIYEAKKKKIDDDAFFVNNIILQIKNQTNKKIVISDFRYPIEYLKLKENFQDIKTIKISRDMNNMINDKSETCLDDFLFDFTIENNKSLQDFYDSIENIKSVL